MVLNISKTKSIVFGINHSLNSGPQLNLVMNGVAVEQVEENKRLGVTIDCKLSRPKHIDSMVVKKRIGLYTIKRHHTPKKQVLLFSLFPLILIIVQSCGPVLQGKI